jgi:hypothetical protein
MSLLDRLEKQFGPRAIAGVITSIIAIQVALYLLNLLQLDLRLANQSIRELVGLVPARVLDGELWRLVSFLFEPPETHPIWAFFYWYLLYFFANTLEQHWGPFRLNLYIFIGWLATVLVAMLVPALRDEPVTNAYLYTSLFLAFAQLYPDFELYIFFVLPVKVKWLALIIWIGFGLSVSNGGWPAFWVAAGTVADFLLFFGAQIANRARHWWRGRRFKERMRSGQSARAAFFHECRVCGLTSKMAPRVQFRYCSQCAGQACYCPEHLRTHDHVVGEPDAAGAEHAEK